MKRIILSVLLSVAILMANTRLVLAEEVCVTQYGGGVVCGVSAPPTPHQPVEAGLEFNLFIVGILFLGTSVFLRLRFKEL